MEQDSGSRRSHFVLIGKELGRSGFREAIGCEAARRHEQGFQKKNSTLKKRNRRDVNRKMSSLGEESKGKRTSTGKVHRGDVSRSILQKKTRKGTKARYTEKKEESVRVSQVVRDRRNRGGNSA